MTICWVKGFRSGLAAFSAFVMSFHSWYSLDLVIDGLCGSDVLVCLVSMALGLHIVCAIGS